MVFSRLLNIPRHRIFLPLLLVLLFSLIVIFQVYRLNESITVITNEDVKQSESISEITDLQEGQAGPSHNPEVNINPANLPLDAQFENSGYGDLDEDLADALFVPHDEQPKKEDFHHPLLRSEERYNPLVAGILKEKYSPFAMTLFSNQRIDKDMSKCNQTEFASTKDLEVTNSKLLDWDLEEFLSNLNNSRPFYWNDLLDNVPKEMEDNSYKDKWFRFGGGSAWLSEYGVHLLTSRLSYCPSGSKVVPLISFVHAQIFDSNWNELKNGVLSVPSGQDKDGQLIYNKLKFPNVFPIDFWYHNDPKGKRLYFGPEDPRVFLVKNKLGFEEPMIVANMPIKVGKDNSGDSQYRVMHSYFPYSNRVVQFLFPEGHVLRRQKNWTPLTPEPSEPFHQTLSFVYRYDDLTILDCDLESGECIYRYKLNPIIKPDAGVGDLRGGTPFVPLPHHDSFKIPSNMKIWVGFARAHIMNCGCGQAMYRPNLVILQEIGGTLFKLSHIGGFMDMNIQMLGWGDNNDLCAGNSVLIPNGISYWNVDHIKEKELEEKNKAEKKDPKKDNKNFDDYLGLTFSVGDKINEVVHIKGLLKYLVNLPGMLDTPTPKSTQISMDNVLCALENSKQYCKIFAEKQKKKD